MTVGIESPSDLAIVRLVSAAYTGAKTAGARGHSSEWCVGITLGKGFFENPKDVAICVCSERRCDPSVLVTIDFNLEDRPTLRINARSEFRALCECLLTLSGELIVDFTTDGVVVRCLGWRSARLDFERLASLSFELSR